MIRRIAIGALTASLLLGLTAWTRLHGIMSLELGGHLPATGIDAGLLYAAEVEAIRAQAERAR